MKTHNLNMNISKESAAATLDPYLKAYKTQPVVEAMIHYVLGMPRHGRVDQMQLRCYRLAEILGSIATPLGKAYLIEPNLNQLDQRALTVSMLDHAEDRFERKLTHGEATLFNAMAHHLNKEVEGHTRTESIALNFATAMRLAACFIEWASKARRAD